MSQVIARELHLQPDDPDERRSPAEPRTGDDVRGIGEDEFEDETDDLDEDDEEEEDDGSF